MRLPAEIDIINRDQNLPGLSLLFNEEALGEKLRLHLKHIHLGTPQSYYLRYKPNTNCLVAYQLPVNDQFVTIHAKAFRQDDPEKFAKWQRKKSLTGILGTGRIAISEYGTIVSVMPNDSKLKGLPYILNKNQQASILKKLFPQQKQLWLGEIKGLRYKPERRYVAQLLSANQPKALIKVYTPSAYQNIAGKINKFSSQGNLRLAKTITRNNRHQMISFEWLEGSLLSEMITSSTWQDSIMENVGAALAQLHQQNVPTTLICLKPITQVQVLESMADWTCFIAPLVAHKVQQINKQLCQKLLSLHQVNFCSIHGDFYTDQVLLMEKNQIGILDLDRCAVGNPASDLGNFIAHLEKKIIFGQLTSNFVNRLKEPLVLGYEAISPYPIRSQLNLYTAISLFCLLGEPFRSRNPDWLTKMKLILERIEQILTNSD